MSTHETVGTPSAPSEISVAQPPHLNQIMFERAVRLTQFAADSTAVGVHSLSELLRPFFAWNPQASQATPPASLEPALKRLNETARALFSWNPQDRRP